MPERIWAVDLDRTLIDTNKAKELLLEECRSDHVDQALLRQSQQEIEASGGSFDVVSYLEQNQVASEEIKAILGAFVVRAQAEQLLYPDSAEFLTAAKERQVKLLIMTYGGQQWQYAKIAGAGLADLPWLITDQKYKGQEISSWRAVGNVQAMSGNGVTFAADAVTLVDDKAVSFSGLPGQDAGYWLQRGDTPLLQSQQGDVPPNVQICRSLQELIPVLG